MEDYWSLTLEDGMKRLGRVLTVAAALWAVSMTGGLAHAAASSVTITHSPEKLELCPGGPYGRALVVVQNSGTSPIRNVCLRAFANGPLTLALSALPASSSPAGSQMNIGVSSQQKCADGVALPELMPGAALPGLLTLKLSGYPQTTPAVVLWADYQTGDKSNGIGGMATGVINIQAPAIFGPDSLKVAAKTSFDSLHENDKGSVLLTISNGTSDTLKLGTSITTKLNDADVVPTRAAAVVPPQSVVVIPYQVTAHSEITPGEYTGLIGVDAQTSCGLAIHRVASYSVKLGVFGQSELLTALGVPSLLLLPGFLILTLWMLLWRFKELGLRVSFLAKSPGAEEFFVGVKDGEFWLLGITFSLLIFFISPKLIGYSGPYNLKNIATLWGLSLLISLALYLAFLWFDRWRKKQAAALALTPKDSPLVAVERMVKRKWPRANCRPVTTKPGVTPEIHGFELWEEKPGESVWVVPRIECVALEGTLGDLDPGSADIDMSELLRQLREITAKKLGAVRWGENASGFGAPHIVKIAELNDYEGDLVIVLSP